MEKKQHIIISAFTDGKSLRGIARETGIDRKTVTKYVRDYEKKREQILAASGGDDIKELTDSIVERPRYKSTNRKKRTTI